jgi:hypothetical protein
MHRLSLGDPGEARASLRSLQQAAADLHVAVVTSPNRFLGDIASAVAARLPGSWEATIERFPQRSDQNDFASWLWDAGPLLSTLQNYRVPCAAILRDGAGTELLLVQRPWDGQYLAGALLPSPDHLNATASAPPSVNAPTAPGLAASIGVRLLPQYERAVLLSQLEEADEDLHWVQNLEPGTGTSTDLAAALDRFQTHAPALIDILRRADHPPLTTDQVALLSRVEAGLGAATTGEDTNTTTSGDAMAVWLGDGPQLLELVRAVAHPPTTGPPRNVPPAVALSPPKAVTSAGRHR